MQRRIFSKLERRLFNQVVSLAVSSAFILTSVLSPAAAALNPESSLPLVESALVKQFTPPAELGTVVDAQLTKGAGTKTPLVIQIQDLHANYSVQTNIAKLLEFLNSRLGAGHFKVAVEGAQGPIAVTELAKISDRAFKAKVCDRLMKEAELTGTEYFSIVNGHSDLLWGVEDQRYHDANVSLFQSTYKGKQQLAGALDKLQKDLLPIKDKFYTRAMRKLDKEAADYAAGKMDAADYTTDLVKKASHQGINIAAQYPELAKWTGYAETEKYANLDKLMTEQADLLKEVQAGQAKTEEQRNIASTVGELDILHRLLMEEVTTEEVRHFAPQMSAVLGRVKYLLDSSRLPYDKANLAELVSASLDFYAVALLRDKFLAGNTLALLDESSGLRVTSYELKKKGIKPETRNPKLETVVLVAGGFHTPGITKILKEKGVSYLTISPTVVSHTEHDKKLYVARLMGRHVNPADIAVGNNSLSWALNNPVSIWLAVKSVRLAALREFGAVKTGILLKPLPAKLAALAQQPTAGGSIKVKAIIPTPLRQFTGKESEVEIDAPNGITRDGFIFLLVSKFPSLGNHLLKNGKLRRFVAIFGSDEEELRNSDDLVSAGDFLIVPSMAGGAPGLEDTSFGIIIKQAIESGNDRVLRQLEPELIMANNVGSEAIAALISKWNKEYPSDFNDSYFPANNGPLTHVHIREVIKEVERLKNPAELKNAKLLLESEPVSGALVHDEDGGAPTLVSREPVTSDLSEPVVAPLLKPVDSAVAKRVTVTVLDYNIGHLFGNGTFTLTKDILDAAKAALQHQKNTGHIKDFVVYGFGQDLHIQINTYGLGTQNRAVHLIGLGAALEALSVAKRHGFLNGISRDGREFDMSELSTEQQINELQVRSAELPFQERGAEPISVMKAINGGIGFFNQTLVNMFFGQKVSNRRLEGAGFFVTVENVAEIREGKKNRQIYFFGDKPDWTDVVMKDGKPVMEDGKPKQVPISEIDVVRSNSLQPLHVKVSDVKTFDEMSVLVGDPTEWVITAVYGAKGRMAQTPLRVEPVAVVGAERAFPTDTSIPTSPILIVRQQGGAPAIGETHMAGTEFYFGPGGEHEGYYTGLLPVTLDEARSFPDTHMVTKVVGYHYQSSRDGEIPEGDIYDQSAYDAKETSRLQRDAMEVVREAAEVDNMVPFMTTEEAERQMKPVREKQASRFTAVPDYKKGDKDPSVHAANLASNGRTLSDIKADIGGKVGHTVVPSYYIPVAKASLEVAKRQGLIDDYKVFYAGDDLHLLMTHSKGIDSQEIHTLAWQTFMRIGWVAYSLKDKWYGLMQDFPNMRGRAVDQDAKLNDEFIELLHQNLPQVQLKSWDALLDAYQNQKPVTGESPFSGNVQGQGPGFAEINITGKDASTFGIFAADKAGPDAFNVPLWYALRRAVEEGKLQAKFGDPKLEVWDIHHALRALFSLISERADLQALLAPTHMNSTKRVWAGDGSNQILAALSVEKLGIIAEGEYIGKDDPVLIAKPEIIKWFFQFARDHFYMTQGNARGSHNAAPKPRSLKEGIATRNSKPVQLGLMVQVTANNQLVLKDMFDDPTFKAAYDRVDVINERVWRAQELTGGLVSVPSAQVEGNYPLVKMKKALLKNSRTYESNTQDLYQDLARASTPSFAWTLGVIFGAVGVALGVMVTPWALLFLIPAAIEIREGAEGVHRNRIKGMGRWQAFVSPAALETENIADFIHSYRGLALHEYGHQLMNYGEIRNFFVKHIVALVAIVTQIVLGLRQLVLWAVHGGRVIQLNAEQSRLSLGLAKLAAVSPIQLVNTVSAAAVAAFKSDAAKQEEIRRQHAQMVAEQQEHGAA